MSTTKLSIPKKKKLAKLIIEGETSMQVLKVLSDKGNVKLVCKNFASSEIEVFMSMDDKWIRFETITGSTVYLSNIKRVAKYLKML